MLADTWMFPLVFSYSLKYLSEPCPKLYIRTLYYRTHPPHPPHLILISGCTGAGKTTFGMRLALAEGIIKCISTDTIRQIMRSFMNDPALHRSSYSGHGDPVDDWEDACKALYPGVNSIVNDCIDRGNSLVLEGVHVIPQNDILDRWRHSGGKAVGVLLVVPDAKSHQSILNKRKFRNRKQETQLNAITRIRSIQEKMFEYAQKNQWIIVEQTLDADPVELVKVYFEDTTNH